MLKLFILGGPVMIFIGISSVMAFAIFLNKIFHFHRAQIDTRKFMNGVKNILKKKSYVEAVAICTETPGPVAALLKAGLVKYEKGEAEIKKAIETASLIEIPRLEKDISVLMSIAYVTPLLGFLGTVVGLMKVFMKIQEKGGIINPGDISAGVWEALICSAAGLVVAIPTFLAYNYLMSRVNSFVLDMERGSTELVGLLTESGEDHEV